MNVIYLRDLLILLSSVYCYGCNLTLHIIVTCTLNQHHKCYVRPSLPTGVGPASVGNAVTLICGMYFISDQLQVVNPVRPTNSLLFYLQLANKFNLLFCCQFYSLLWRPNVIGQAIIFLPCGFFCLSFFFSSPNLSRPTLDVYHTSTHGVALVRI